MPKVTSNSAIKGKPQKQYINESAKKLDSFLGKKQTENTQKVNRRLMVCEDEESF